LKETHNFYRLISCVIDLSIVANFTDGLISARAHIASNLSFALVGLYTPSISIIMVNHNEAFNIMLKPMSMFHYHAVSNIFIAFILKCFITTS